jgi:hypothetical protein
VHAHVLVPWLLPACRRVCLCSSSLRAPRVFACAAGHWCLCLSSAADDACRHATHHAPCMHMHMHMHTGLEPGACTPPGRRHADGSVRGAAAAAGLTAARLCRHSLTWRVLQQGYACALGASEHTAAGAVWWLCTSVCMLGVGPLCPVARWLLHARAQQRARDGLFYTQV